MSGPSLEPLLMGALVVKSDGVFADGLRNGNGLIELSNGCTYKGSVSGGLPHGTGKMTWPDGSSYSGQFEGGLIQGKGDYLWADGSKYSGDVCNGLRHGEGTFVGTWELETSAFTPPPVEQAPDSVQNSNASSPRESETSETAGEDPPMLNVIGEKFVSYEGSWKDGLIHGKGTKMYSRSKVNSYTGSFVEGLEDGFGIRLYPGGAVYAGNWKQGHKAGFGKMVWSKDGEVYEGMWEDDLPHGRGEYVWYNAELEASVDDTVEGVDAVSFPTAGLDRLFGHNMHQHNRYVGEYSKGKKQGPGVFYYADGAVLTGTWHADLKEGHGVLLEDTGSCVQCHFAHDKLVYTAVEKFAEEDSHTDLGLSLTGPLNLTASSEPKQVAAPTPRSEIMGSPLQVFTDQYLPLHVPDLIARDVGFEADPALVEEISLKVKHVVMRRFGLIKKVFRDYYNLPLGDLNGRDHKLSYSITKYQWWSFIRDFGITSPGLQAFEIDELIKAANVRKWKPADQALSQKIQATQDPHDPEYLMSFIDFVDILVRLSVVRYKYERPLEKAVRNMMSDLENVFDGEGGMGFVVTEEEKNLRDVIGGGFSVLRTAFEGALGSSSLGDPSKKKMTVGDTIRLLKNTAILDEEASIDSILSLHCETNYGQTLDNLLQEKRLDGTPMLPGGKEDVRHLVVTFFEFSRLAAKYALLIGKESSNEVLKMLAV